MDGLTNQWINQSTDQSINESADQWIFNQSMDQHDSMPHLRVSKSKVSYQLVTKQLDIKELPYKHVTVKPSHQLCTQYSGELLLHRTCYFFLKIKHTAGQTGLPVQALETDIVPVSEPGLEREEAGSRWRRCV